jgi:formate/nitrite transporter
MTTETSQVDGLLPPEVARRAEAIGVAKVGQPAFTLFVLAVLAGAFISLGATFATAVQAGSAGAVPYGIARLLAGLAFSLGLVLVVVGGAELFTGNNLIVMAWASRRVRTRALLRNWAVVYAGNAVGALLTALLVLATRQHEFGGGAVGVAALRAAAPKVSYAFGQAVALGVLCNGLVCLAIWMSLGARSVGGRIAAVLLPVTAFVTIGLEHCVANFYYLPYALLLRAHDPAFAAASGVDLGGLTWQAALTANLLPVTLGNVVGGSGLVALASWAVYLRSEPK